MPVDRKSYFRLLKKPKFNPTDCPNFIAYKSFSTYKWYARVTAPLLLTSRGGPIFIGKTKRVLWGSYGFDSWMVVRYPSHVGMLKMVSNPYYMLVCNPFRVRAVSNFELAFTRPVDPDSGLEQKTRVLALHASPDDANEFFESVRKIADKAGLREVYASESVYDFDFIKNPGPTDPKPLSYPVTIALGGASEDELSAFAGRNDVVALLEAQPLATAIVYERMSKFEYVKFGK